MPISKKKAGYIVPIFPVLTHTFTMREMLALVQENVEVYVFSLKTPRGKDHSSYAESLLSNTFYSPFILSLPLIRAQLHSLLRKPGVYCTILIDILRKTWSTPIVLLKSIGIFPKSVLFASFMEEYEIDHIHADFVHIPTTVAMIISRLTGIPFSCTGHNSDIYEYPPADLEDRIKLATPFITISAFWKRHLITLFGEGVGAKIEVVHCGIDLEEFQWARAAHVGPTRLLTVARLEPVKGLRYLIEACHLLRERGLDFRCHILGDGYERQNLERLVREKDLESLVTFHGAVLPENVLDFYQQADIFVLPSLREGIPVVAMEAMAMELPVVSTNVFGIPELVQDGISGILVDAGNTEELASAIETLCRDRKLRVRLGNNGRRKVEREFDIKESAKRLSTLFFGEESVDRDRSQC